MTYTVRSIARTGIGSPDVHQVLATTRTGRQAVLTEHATRAAAAARVRFMRAPLGTQEREEARRDLEAG